MEVRILMDKIEKLRRQQLIEVNLKGPPKDRLTTEELRKEFEVLSFAAPYVVVIRKSDGIKGSMEFTHNPRYYFNFQKA